MSKNTQRATEFISSWIILSFRASPFFHVDGPQMCCGIVRGETKVKNHRLFKSVVTGARDSFSVPIQIQLRNNENRCVYDVTVDSVTIRCYKKCIIIIIIASRSVSLRPRAACNFMSTFKSFENTPNENFGNLRLQLHMNNTVANIPDVL
jgi:hypothetical protein